MCDIRILVGNRIRDLRKAIGISQESLALKIDLDRTYIASVENGRRNVSIINIEKICKGLDISVSDFFSSEAFSD